MRHLVTVLALTAGLARAAHADAPPAPYAVPFQLRSAAAANVVRLDSSLAASKTGETGVSFAFASYKAAPGWAPFVRAGVVANWPDAGNGATSLTNPLVGVAWAPALPAPFKLAASLSCTIPVGTGGGNEAEPTRFAADKAGILARSAMDNAMFAVNDFTVIPGIDFAWVDHGVTVQAEATVLQLTRVRGDKVQPDASRTNFTSGVFVGWFALPQLSIGGELRYQRWLSTPVAVTKAPETRDTLSMAVGVRGHVPVGSHWLRPGLAYMRGLDAPMTTQEYQIVQLDLLFAL